MTAVFSGPVRRGLPRAPGGEPWPPVGERTSAPPTEEGARVIVLRRGLPRAPGGEPWPPLPATELRGVEVTGTPDDVAPAPADERTTPAAPVPPRPTVWQGVAPAHPAPEHTRRWGRFTPGQWIGGGAVLLVIVALAAAMAVAGTRWLLSTAALRDFVAIFPGTSALPEGAPVGLPAWVGWQHFFNMFFMALIIRSGIQIRRGPRPRLFWRSRRGGERARAISITLWFHLSLDLLWVSNGIVFVLLLVLTGQWMRIVPTSWDVLPNALSAALQYISLDWPVENGWVHYNALQQIFYFLTVFVAAPLAVISGMRMSPLWPERSQALNRLVPLSLARRLHFPVMLYFVGFIVVHVSLVLATGALRNLTHIYLAQGSIDPDAFADNWAGFCIFVVSILAIIGSWIAARPALLAPIARLFGTVSAR